MHALADMKADLMELAELLRKLAQPTPDEFTLTAEDIASIVLEKIPSNQWHEWERSK